MRGSEYACLELSFCYLVPAWSGWVWDKSPMKSGEKTVGSWVQHPGAFVEVEAPCSCSARKEKNTLLGIFAVVSTWGIRNANSISASAFRKAAGCLVATLLENPYPITDTESRVLVGRIYSIHTPFVPLPFTVQST